jgi:hypothetical protein
VNPIDYLRLGVEQYLRELPDDEFSDLVKWVRPPEDEDKPPSDERASFARSLFRGGN